MVLRSYLVPAQHLHGLPDRVLGLYDLHVVLYTASVIAYVSPRCAAFFFLRQSCVTASPCVSMLHYRISVRLTLCYTTASLC
jgi:hypothetical protein